MSQTSQPVDDFVFLNGRPPIQEFIGFIKIMAANGHDIESNALVREWRSANDRVRELEQAESGFADNPVVGPIDPVAAPFLQAALASPSAQKTFGAVPVEWCTVELDRLVVYQRFINLRYVGELKGVVPAALGPIEVARLRIEPSRFWGNCVQSRPNSVSHRSEPESWCSRSVVLK